MADKFSLKELFEFLSANSYTGIKIEISFVGKNKDEPVVGNVIPNSERATTDSETSDSDSYSYSGIRETHGDDF